MEKRNQNYSIEHTYHFLQVYATLESDQASYQYLDFKYPEQMKLFRHMRNDLAHNSSESFNYPFIVSEDIVNEISAMLDEVTAKTRDVLVPFKKLTTVTIDTPIYEVFDLMINSNYSYLPIVDQLPRVIGIITADGLLSLIQQENGGTFDLKKAGYVQQYMEYFKLDHEVNDRYMFIDPSARFFETRAAFSKTYYSGQVLGVVFMTNNGQRDGKLLGMLTAYDIAAKA